MSDEVKAQGDEAEKMAAQMVAFGIFTALKNLEAAPKTREMALVRTKLEEAQMWLERAAKAIDASRTVQVNRSPVPDTVPDPVHVQRTPVGLQVVPNPPSASS